MQRLIGVSAATLVFMLAWMPLGAKAKNFKVWTGRVDHVSTGNIKIYNPRRRQELSFVLLPRFEHVFSAKGDSTYQMARIKPGMMVRVYYDQHALGVRHADRIYVFDQNYLPITSMKS